MDDHKKKTQNSQNNHNRKWLEYYMCNIYNGKITLIKLVSLLVVKFAVLPNCF